MQPRLGLLRGALEDEVVIAAANRDVRNDLPELRRHLGRGPVDEEMFRGDEIENRPRAIANQPRREKRLKIGSADDHHLLGHLTFGSVARPKRMLTALLLLATQAAHEPAKWNRAFRELDEMCARDAGRMWGVSLCGPTLLVDPKTRNIV